MKQLQETLGFKIIEDWMKVKGIEPFDFQISAWKKYHEGFSGMVIAPTGFGKTYSVFLAVLIHFMNHSESYQKGLKFIWITPLRSLSKDIARAMQEVIDEIGLDWVVEVRNGDTDAKVKQRQTKNMPDILLLTPESLHLLLAQKSRNDFFKNLKCVAIDEWHELLATKRGVMIELALSYLKEYYKQIRIWGITATIGNLKEAQDVLLTNTILQCTIVCKEKKIIDIVPVFPPEVELLPWAGHLGSKMVDAVVPIILKSKSTIIFTNTRNQSEQWYQLLLESYPDLAGQMALHHSSIDAPIRQWIEEALSEGTLKAVVATSSLDLGVDFKPVDTVIQIGSSKGVARFVQRAGRSGHGPREISKIYFVPTHSLELIELAALKAAVKHHKIEARIPLMQTFDVLVQFLITIALGGGFDKMVMEKIVRNCYGFQYMTDDEWRSCLMYITVGGEIGERYDEYKKVEVDESGLYVVKNRRVGMIHRMNIGVIVSDAMIKVKFVSGGYVGMVEEYFITKLKAGDKFILAGRVLELVRMKDMIAYVRSSKGKGITPSWMGGRLPLTSNLSEILREKMPKTDNPSKSEIELNFLQPMLEAQRQLSHVPSEDEFLVEMIENKDGYHLFMYPFEGRLVHEVMAAIVAYRISKLKPIAFTIAMNDYGFELYSDTPIELSEEDIKKILSKDHLSIDIFASINATEMAKRKFRDIAVIAGYVIQNVYGKHKTNRSLQTSSGIIFNVLEEHDPENIFLKQAYQEVFFQQLEEPRLIDAFNRIENSKIVIKKVDRFTPLCFPIKVDSLRQSLSSEDLATRVQKLQQQSNKKSTRKR